MRNKKKLPASASNLLSAGIAAVFGFAAISLSIMLFGFLLTKIDLDDSVLSLLTSAGLCIGAYVGGYVAARHRRQSGLLMGLLCGLLMFGIIFILSYLFAGTAGGFSGSAKLIMTLVCAAAGGVIGVNSKRNWFRFK